MRRVILPMALIFSISMIACSDDGDTPDKDTGSNVEASTPDQSTKDMPMTEGSVSDGTGGGADWNMAGKCANATDAALLDTKTKRDGVTAKAGACGQGCLTDPKPSECAAACVVKDTGLSSDCSGCYAGIIMCAITNCLSECATDPSSAACTKCQVDKGCISTFYSCSGLPQS